MTTKKVLTRTDIGSLITEIGQENPFELCRAIEQAVLQSEQVQALREDAEAFRLMVSKRLTVSVRELGHEVEVFYLDDCLAWPACDPNADDDTRAEVARYAIATAVAAMKEQR